MMVWKRQCTLMPDWEEKGGRQGRGGKNERGRKGRRGRRGRSGALEREERWLGEEEKEGRK